MIDISTLDRSDQIGLLSQLEEALGWYPIVSLDVEDLRERFIDEGEDVPPDWILHRACKYVSRKNDEDNGHLYEWAQDVALELLADTEKETA
jgi:hypothetical protein